MSQQPDPVNEPASDASAAEEVAAAVVGAFPDGDADSRAAEDGVTPPAGEGDTGEGDAVDPVHQLLGDVDGDGDPEDTRTREELLVAVTTAERERDEYLDDLRRSRAEFENFRRRTQRDAGTARDAGRGDVAGALLDVLDDLDRTLDAAEDSADPGLAKGVSLVAEKLTTTLAGLGLVRLDPLGDPFDPSLHEAVQQVPADEPNDAPLVESTLRPGYRLGDRVLRPAMVVVKG
ncbi:MAG: nucleotide exchange factor GrpE [Nitriliruptor sp.]|uniref:nucleotide exchange factor GrpE n=1 Tax=Nitriliruptor sp. TaxID=2448056 RepID=UPI0034A0709A